jgi:mono/diheme cytochrome c family protein
MIKDRVVYTIIALIVLAFLLTACGVDKTKPGAAVNLTGDSVAGKTVYDTNCAKCHGAAGVGGVANPGSADETVPELVPIDPAFNTVASMDLVIQHGSEPEGNSPSLKMSAYGDKNLLTQQQIADVIAYVLSLNK